MKGAVCVEFGKPWEIQEMELDKPARGEVMVKVAACAICHSDIHSAQGEHSLIPLPAVGGHEIAGYIAEIGEGVTYVKPGDPVIVSIPQHGCGHCYYCLIGQGYNCPNFPLKLAAPGRYTNNKGQRLWQFAGDIAGFVEYTTCSENHVVKIPQNMPLDRACLLACGVISGFGAIVNRAKVKPFDSVAVVGAGGVGLNAVQGARFSGAHPVIAVDVMEGKLEMARKFGATHTVNSRTEKDAVQKVKEITDGRGADVIIVAVAGIEILRQAFNMSSRNGMTVVIGHAGREWMSTFDATEFVGGKIMSGSAMGATRPRLDIPRLIDLYQHGRLKLDELVSRRYPFAQINQAMDDSMKGDALRNVLIF
ncbi:MAG TPA: zinc-binding dehydrogenase [Dehalococcoidales bacterium]|nr:zinc-binding dehydrogenase [Dehalococcoidales bacterium]